MSEFMQQSRVMLSAGTLAHTGFVDRVNAAKAAGFDAISIFPQQYLKARKRERLSPRDMREILSSCCISLDEVDPLLDWFERGVSPSEELIFEIAGELGARSINAAPALAPAMELPEVTAALARLAERADRQGLRVDLEFLPWTLIPDLTTALRVVGDTGRDNVGVMLDFWHYFRVGGSVASVLNLTAAEAALVTSIQLSGVPASPLPLTWRNRIALVAEMMHSAVDGVRVNGARRFLQMASSANSTHPNATALMQEAISGRLLPDEGDMPVSELLAALEGAGCIPTVGLEIFSLELGRLPATEIASRSMAAWRRVSKTS